MGKLLRGHRSFTSDRGPSVFYSLNLSTCRTQRLRRLGAPVKHSMVNAPGPKCLGARKKKPPGGTRRQVNREA